jgi:chemotaxis protein methyltransferase CheR
MITFREFNLVEPWPQLPKFDVIFIRNVLIYFNDATRRAILGKMRGVLQPDGYLFLGGAETTLNLDDNYEIAPVKRSGCYRLKQKTSMAA